MFNEQTRHRQSQKDDEEKDALERRRNTQDAVFDLDNCLQERRSRDDNKDDYKMTIGESKTDFKPSITSKQFSLNGMDVLQDAKQIYQNIDLKGITTIFNNPKILYSVVICLNLFKSDKSIIHLFLKY